MLSVDKTISVDLAASVGPVASVDPVALEKTISSATEALLGYRQSDGHFVFELEADSTIPSTARSKPRSQTICAAPRATMAAGRWCRTARST
jgi:hypothetical protein